MRRLINIDLYAKVMLTVIAACLVGVCTGMDCQGNMPAALPLDIPDGTYAGPVTGRTTSSFDGNEIPPTVGAGYQIVEIVGGRIQTRRRAFNKNGPFSCESIEPGSERTIALLLAGSDGNEVDTITGTMNRGFEYVVSFSIDGGLPFTGEGSFLVTPTNGGIDLTDTNGLAGSLSGQMVEVTRTTTGFLQRIGDNGTVPEPDGMNGEWILGNTEGALAGITIRGLRVTLYVDVDGKQEVTSSDPVSASTSPADGVFFSFEAMILFQGDTAPTLFRITFRGEVGPNGQITGETTFTADGEEPIVLTLTLERVPSPDC